MSPMQALFPLPAETTPEVIDPAAAIAEESRPPRDGRPWVYTNMVASADGAITVEGASGGLGGEADFTVFKALREVADVILAGAETVRVESYRPARIDEAGAARRRERGQAPFPTIAVVTSSLDLDPALPLFDDPERPPTIITARSSVENHNERAERLASRSRLITAGEDWVDLEAALAELANLGARRVLCEGGASINGQLIALDLVDEWNLTLSPNLVAGPANRPAVGPLPAGPPKGMKLSRVWQNGDFLFCRWIRPAARPD